MDIANGQYVLHQNQEGDPILAYDTQTGDLFNLETSEKLGSFQANQIEIHYTGEHMVIEEYDRYSFLQLSWYVLIAEFSSDELLNHQAITYNYSRLYGVLYNSVNPDWYTISN